ncbi:MAG: PaaI family thioesterase [Pseudomonadota bacterium]|nr:PaaI family thioesterase [Pseudomonadota bacterium]
MTDFPAIADSPLNRLLGVEIVSFDPEKGHVKCTFNISEDLNNLQGIIHGGIIATMLDQLCGLALAYKRGKFKTPEQVTLDLNVRFMRPVASGPLWGIGQVERMGRTIGFVESMLYDDQDRLLAKASTSFKIFS